MMFGALPQRSILRASAQLSSCKPRGDRCLVSVARVPEAPEACSHPGSRFWPRV